MKINCACLFFKLLMWLEKILNYIYGSKYIFFWTALIYTLLKWRSSFRYCLTTKNVLGISYSLQWIYRV